MQYQSTRGGKAISAAEAIVQGICPLGGLYVPQVFPRLSLDTCMALSDDYPALAAYIMQPFLDIKDETLLQYTRQAYGPQFDTRAVGPTVSLSPEESVLELWHGPTLAFKDMALQMLPYLMRDSLRAIGEEADVYILVATSGDTGKAALAGFSNVPGTALHVFYPHGGVSKAQWLQMVTQTGDNVFVCGVEGNFDDAQTAVKRIFADRALNERLHAMKYRFSSANSINFGRLLPQIAYYFTAYAQLCKAGTIKQNDAVNFCVPTGNFGNILAGYYAMRMGLPVHKFICASNRNNVLTDFFHTGVYDKERPFYQSMSCSIDILVSSNLERLLFEISGRNSQIVTNWMQELNGKGTYDIGNVITKELQSYFYADWCDEKDTLQTIKAQFEQTGYLMDPHTAVAQTVYARYQKEQRDPAHTVLLSTAHPFKFASDVLRAFEEPSATDDEQNAARLREITGHSIPDAIAALGSSPVLHPAICSIDDMPRRVIDVLPKRD